MKKLKPVGIIAIICLIGLGIVLGSRSGRSDADSRSNGKTVQPRTGTTAGPVATPAPDATPSPPAEMPEHIKFKFLFEHLANINDKPGILREYQGKTGLPDGVFNVLVLLAVEHEQQAVVIDQHAKIIIDNFHAQYPRNMPPGMAPPPPPRELLDLQDQRDALSLRYRDRLKTQIGDETYARLKQFMDDEFRPKPMGVQGTPPKPPVLPRREAK